MKLSKKGVAVALGVTALIYVASQVRKWPRRISLRPLLAFMFASLVSDVWDTIIGGTKGITDTIKGFVKSVVDAAIGAVSDVINDVQSSLSDAWNAINDLVDSVGNSIGNVGNAIFNTLKSLISEARTWATAEANRALSWAQRGIDQLRADASSLLNNAIDDVRQWAADLVNGARTVLQSAINGVTDFVTNDVIPWAKSLIDVISKWATDAVSWLDHRLGIIEALTFGPFKEAVAVVEKAWDWLVWLGAHAFSSAEDLFNTLAHSSYQTITDMFTEGLLKNGQNVANQLADWMGL